MGKVRWLNVTAANQNLIHKEIKRKCLLSFSWKTFLMLCGSKKCKDSHTHEILPVLHESEMWTVNLEGRLKRMFISEIKVVRGWRKLLEEYYNLCAPTGIMVIISMKVRWEGNVAQMGDVCEMCTEF